MRVVETEIPDMDSIDDWFKSHKFIYAMMSKSVKTDLEETDMMTLDLGTIESIAMKTRDAFRDFQGKWKNNFMSKELRGIIRPKEELKDSDVFE